MNFETTMDLLKQRLMEALEQAGEKKTAVFDKGTSGAVTYCAASVMGRTPDCFCDVSAGRKEQTLFGKPVKSLQDCVESGEYFVLDVNQDRRFMKLYAKMKQLKEGIHYSSLQGLFDYRNCDLTDPLTGYSRRGDIPGLPGFLLFGNSENWKQSPVKIVALGGSTTDGTYGGRKSWPEHLHKLLLDRGIDQVVLSGGMIGYSSTEERDRFLRDVLPLQPDLVISLSGINDLIWKHGDPSKNHYSSYFLKQIVENAYRPDLRPGERIGYGLNQERTNADLWIRNQGIIHFAAEEFGIGHLCFLQPCMLCPGYTMSGFEKAWSSMIVKEPSYRKSFARFAARYREASSKISAIDYITDLTDVFDQTPGVYVDGIHCSEEGNRILAERIANEILRMKRKKHV